MTATKQQPIAGYRISDPSDPTIKPWLSDTPDDNGYTSEPLYAGAAPAAVAGPVLDVTLDEDQAGLLRDMLGDHAEYPEAITVRLMVGDGHSGLGLYVAQAEYQDEGAVLLASLPAPAAPSAVAGRTVPRNDDERAAAQFFADNPSAALLAWPLYLARDKSPALEAPAAETIAEAITNNFRDAGWSMPSIDTARVLEAVKSALGPAAAPQAPAAPVGLPWRTGIPPWTDDRSVRVIAVTAQDDFGGVQVHDIRASDFHTDGDGDGAEVARVCTHWAYRDDIWPRADAAAPDATVGVVGWVKDECTGPGAFDPMFVRGAAPLPAGYVANYRPVVYAAAPAAPSAYSRSQHDADSRELRSLCIARDAARRERDLARAETAGLQASTGHLSALLDGQHALLEKAKATMTALHGSASPIDESGGDFDARIPASAFARFVDAHAELLHAMAQSPVAAPAAPAVDAETSEDAERFRAMANAALTDDEVFGRALDQHPDMGGDATIDDVRAMFDAARAAQAKEGGAA